MNFYKKNKLFRSILRQTLIWAGIFAFWVFLRNFGIESVKFIGEPTPLQWIRIHSIISISAGIIFGSLSYLFEYVFFKKMTFGLLTLIASSTYLLAIFLIAVLGASVFVKILGLQVETGYVKSFIFSQSGLVFFVYCFVMGFFVDVFKEVNKKFGPGNLWKMIRGEFHHPKEDERIFMFLDLKSSTHYAEKLGHLKFSMLIQDCFSELEVIFKYNAEVYQYVGDEVVLSWSMREGLENGNCLRAFFAFMKKIEERSDYYISEYGFVPEFKAGINGGKITVAEVGEVKREIAFHGDVLNTASRVQGKCNELGAKLLVTENMINIMNKDNPYNYKEVGRVQLRGKASGLLLYSVNES